MKSINAFKERYPKAVDYALGKLATVARYHLAAIFILSGISKAIDPFGLSIKIGEYLSAMSFGFLEPLSGLGSVLMPAGELAIGLMLLTGVSRRVTAWLTFVVMTFFTLLTLWLAIANPVSDCGCFGDLVHLTNWETFFKNLVFYPFAVVFFLARNRQRCFNPAPLRTILTYAAIVPLSLGPGLYSLSRLPLIDPTPFRTGINIPRAMQAEEGETETILIYRDRQSGKLHDFAIDDTTWYDSDRWEYVDTRTLGTSNGPAIKSVPMFDGAEDLSPEILGRRGYTLIFAVNRFDPKYADRMEEMAGYLYGHNGRTVALSATVLPARLADSGIELLSSDNTVLRTMAQNRRGGALLLHDGTIVGKWSLEHLPDWKESAKDPMSYVLEADRLERERLLTLIFSLAVTVIVLASIGRFGRRSG